MMLGARLCDDGRILAPNGLRLTLQRAFQQDWKEACGVPRSYGRLPFVFAPNEEGFAIPILSGEIVWIGLEAPPHEAIAILKFAFLDSGRDLHLQCPPDYAVGAVYSKNGPRPITVGDTMRISVYSTKDYLSCCFILRALQAEGVLPPRWQEAHGELDRSRGYSGKRLP